MGIFNKLFGKKEKMPKGSEEIPSIERRTTVKDVTDTALANWMASTLNEHIEKITHVHPKIERLREQDILSEISTTAVKLMRQSVTDGGHHSAWLGDTSLQILVSTFRSLDFDLRPFFKSGYIPFVESYWSKSSYLTQGGAEFIHVIFDTNLTEIQVHLHYLPRDGSSAIMPLDIMTEKEKEKFGTYKDGDHSVRDGKGSFRKG